MKHNNLTSAAVCVSIFFGSLAVVGCSREVPELDDAGDHYVAAQDAIAAGDNATALAELNKSIQLREDAWSYFERAQIYAKQGDDASANADIQKGLQIDPNNTKLKWLSREMKQPKKRRFEKEQPISVGK
jgi:Flp pilus assembly protein TadD